MASKYGWLITKDHLAEGPDDHSCEGISGPRNLSDEMEASLRAGNGRAFRMYDDDGELYVSGRIITTDAADPLDSEWVMAPLDDYGDGGLGCTEIRYAVAGGKWVAI
jgi:hypothetical protein